LKLLILTTLLAAVQSPAPAEPIPVPRLAPLEGAQIDDAALAVAPRLAPRAEPAPFDPGLAPFMLTVDGDLEIRYRVFALFVRPGQTLAINASQPVRMDGGAPETAHNWTAPQEPGEVVRTVLQDETGDEMRLNLVVMHPHDPQQGEALNGYRIGAYPGEPFRNLDAYRAPDHFIAVPAELEELEVSPHFRLGQFVSKQAADSERYLVLNERLVVKLELILEAANARGWRAETLTVMSGYRTPSYNRAIGNGVYSRHVYGGAADIFIDTNGDGRMDDLNGDGVVDRRDAALLYDLVEDLSGRPDFAPYIGGLGEYGPTSRHRGFVHVDERGYRARWGRSQS